MSCKFPEGPTVAQAGGDPSTTLSFALRNGNFASGRQNLYTERSEEASVIELSEIRLIEVATEKQTCNKRRGYFTALPIPC
jgi:hypothetical protein